MRKAAIATIFAGAFAASGCGGGSPGDLVSKIVEVSPQRDESETPTSHRVVPEPDSPLAIDRPKAGNVDPAEYETAPGRFNFRSPNSDLMCGMYVSTPLQMVGCQSPTVTSGQTCDESAGVEVVDEIVERKCFTDDVYSVPASPTLAYGQTLEVQGSTCTSTEAGITCFQGEPGFTVGADGVTLF